MKPTRIIDEIADEFEAAWLAGQVPKVEDFVAKIDEEHRPALLAALMPLDLTYRGKLGETVESGNAVDSGKAESGFEVTLDSDSGSASKPASSSTTRLGAAQSRISFLTTLVVPSCGPRPCRWPCQGRVLRDSAVPTAQRIMR